jgi:hypothetical protein
MKDVKTKTRVDWIQRVLGKGRRFTEGNLRRARFRLLERGFIIIAESAGPAFERVAAVRLNSPATILANAYIADTRWFRIDQIEQAIGDSLFSHKGIAALSNLGFVIMRQLGDKVELRLIDTRLARFINEARLGPQQKGFGVRPLTEAALCLRHPKSRGIHITDDRRLQVADRLAMLGVDCDDILGPRKRVRLVSRWILGRAVEKDMSRLIGG